MLDFQKLFVHILVSPFKSRALEAEIVLIRHQRNVLRWRVPSKPKLTVTDRLIFVWLRRLFPSARSALASSSQRPYSAGIGKGSAGIGDGGRVLVALT